MLIARVRSGSTFSHTSPPHICHATACRVPCIAIVQRNTNHFNSTGFDQFICDLDLTYKLT